MNIPIINKSSADSNSDSMRDAQAKANQNWDLLLQLQNASTEQLSLYRTQTLVNLDLNFKVVTKELRFIRRLLVAIVILLVLLALLS